jgi:hypothetical protein
MSETLFERAVRDWLEDGDDRPSQPAIDAVLLAVKTTPQDRGLRIPRRFTTMPTYLRLATAAAIIAVAGVGAITYLGDGPKAGTTTPPATPTAPATGVPTAPTATFTVDVEAWTPYTSEVHGITTAYPPGWAVRQEATRGWDAAIDVPFPEEISPAADVFVNDARTVALRLWNVPADIEAIANSRPALIAWVEEFCDSADYFEPCDGIAERAIPMCRERRDCHPDAVIVPFDEDTVAFFVGAEDALTIAHVPRGDADPAAAQYGGAIRLLQAFLETMNVTVPQPEPGG